MTLLNELIAIRWGYERERDKFRRGGSDSYVSAVGALRAVDRVAIDLLGFSESEFCYRDDGKRQP